MSPDEEKAWEEFATVLGIVGGAAFLVAGVIGLWLRADGLMSK